MKTQCQGLVWLCCLLLALVSTAQAEENRGYEVGVGDLAPNFKATKLDGSSVSLDSLRGKIIMLQFTASWCGVCRTEMPFIEKEIWQIHKENKDFILLGIDVKEPANIAKKFAKETGISYPFALDPTGDIFDLYTSEGAGITRNIIIDRKGKIALLTRLFERQEFNKMKKTITALLATGQRKRRKE